MSYTKGEWEVSPNKHSGSSVKTMVRTKDDIAICDIYGGSGLKEALANARLIAAAPELLEACKHLVSILGDEDEEFYNKHIAAFNMGMDAIKRVEG